MQSTLKNTALFIATALLLFNCEHPDTSVQTEPVKTEQIDFMGEKVIIPSDFQKELFNQSQEDFSKYYNALKANSNARETGEEGGLTYEELNSILLPFSKRYPRLVWDESISKDDLLRILKDFPTISNAEEAQKKLNVIFAFYETLMKNEVLLDVIKYENSKTSGNGRILDESPTTLTEAEKNVLLAHPLKAPHYAKAAVDATNFTNGFYGDPLFINGKIGNAFQHASWNALAIRFVLKNTPCSENEAITFVREGTSAHETNINGQVKDLNSAMDLHNNMSARQWMGIKTKWGIGPFRKMPDVDEIINTMKDRANQSAIQPINNILNWHGGVNNDTWNRLYNDNTSPNEHLVHVIN